MTKCAFFAAAMTGLLCVVSQLPAEDLPFEDRVAKSQPLDFGVIRKHGGRLSVTHLLMEEPYLTTWFANGPKSLSIQEGKLYALFGSEVHCLVLPKEDDGKLVYDTAFGENGIQPYDKDAGWQPAETFNGDRFSSRPLGDLVGTFVRDPFKHLLVTSAEGAEISKLGAAEGDGRLCSLDNAGRWKNLVFILDSNCRDIDVWTIEGKFLFEIETKELGLDYPWPMSIDITDEGELYLGYTQERGRIDGTGDSGVTESAFVKISGLDTIDAEADYAKE